MDLVISGEGRKFDRLAKELRLRVKRDGLKMVLKEAKTKEVTGGNPAVKEVKEKKTPNKATDKK